MNLANNARNAIRKEHCAADTHLANPFAHYIEVTDDKYQITYV